MDDQSYTDDDLEAFFGSPDSRRAAQAARESPVGGDGEDAELAAFFGSPDVGGDGASTSARLT
ncbi:hypothetical protein, partial [Rubrivirga sp.]|uniref:hypothetical protein n=1 Tax=Rubrivirga sp. TaxID=1885344 RepID=UPI003C793FC2